MSRFSIKDIEIITGIKAHTLRMWEQRYNFLKPKRTETNIRYYDDNDLRFVLNVSVLQKYGMKISDISRMPVEKIQEMVLVVSEKDSPHAGQIKAMISAMFSMDEYEFEHILSANILRQGLEETMIHVVFPFLQNVGLMWLTGSIHPAHEHFISNLIRRKLFVAIDAQAGKRQKNHKNFLLFLPEGEMHEIGLLLACYMIRSRGHETVYLGQNLPLSGVKNLGDILEPDYVISVINSSVEEQGVQEFMEQLSATWPESRILLAGNLHHASTGFNLPFNVSIMEDIAELRQFIDQLQVPEMASVGTS